MIWCSPNGARVHADNACVCPRVNNPEPWTRGNKPVSEDNGRISSSLRPSGRIFIDRDQFTYHIFSRSSVICLTSFNK